MPDSGNIDTPRPLATTVEAILYLKAQPMSLSAIAEYANCDTQTAQTALIELMENYARRDSALELIETANGYSLQLREVFQDLIQVLVPVELGVGALRTLAVIALKGPIAQADLVNLRGSGVYQQVQELAERGFVRKQRQPSGRSYWLQVTAQFYRYFQVDELPTF